MSDEIRKYSVQVIKPDGDIVGFLSDDEGHAAEKLRTMSGGDGSRRFRVTGVDTNGDVHVCLTDDEGHALSAYRRMVIGDFRITYSDADEPGRDA